MNAEKSITDSNKSVLGYFILCITKKYFCFKGRARRKEYWSFMLFPILINLALSFSTIVDGISDNDINIIRGIVILVLLIPGFAVLFRRLHDINFSGLWGIAPFLGMYIGGKMLIFAINGANTGIAIILLFSQIITIISSFGFWAVFILTLFESDMKENKYGPIPEGVK